MPLRCAVIFLSLCLIYPQDSLSAAREAFALWQQTVAPSLLPFFALIPALTGPEAAAVFARLLRIPCRLLGIPADFAAAVGVALCAGSPAGTRALMRIAARAPHSAGGLFRAAMLCAGVSPGFLISGVGAGMLHEPSAGAVLLLSQLLALLCTCPLLHIAALPDIPLQPPPAGDAAEPPILFAAQGVLSILVWMTLFAVGTRLLSLLLPAAAPVLPFFAEFSAGCARAAALPLPPDTRLPLLAAVIGFGGICAACQNLSVLRPLHLPAGMYIAGKCIHAALCAAFARLLGKLPLPAPDFSPQHVLPVLCAACLLPLLLRRSAAKAPL